MRARSTRAAAAAKLASAAGSLRDLGQPALREALAAEIGAAPALMRHALPWALRGLAGETWAHALDRLARRLPRSLAYVDAGTGERWTWAEVDARARRVAGALHARGVRRGEVVAYLAGNGPGYLAAVMGMARLGVTGALLDPRLSGRPLRHATLAAAPRLVLVSPALEGALDAAGVDLPRLRDDHALPAARPPGPVRARRGEDFVYIFTSGTTGFPKPVRITHTKGLVAGAAFGAGIFGLRPGEDTLYNVLPLHHASGLLLGAGACLTAGVPMVLRERFRASLYWDDVRAHGVTALLYIGELFRYLVAQEPRPNDRSHRVRVAAGNGLRPDVWEAFQARFAVPRIVEFYGATEAPGFLVNLTGRVGAVGHLPLRRAGWLELARHDAASGELVRSSDGRAIPCGPGEPGELLVRVPELGPLRDLVFQGYTDAAATERKILRDVFQPGDAWFRSGDLLRRDAGDYFYFVDRLGDTFRWKGENVSTAEVADVLATAPGVAMVAVVGVEVPGHEGRAGLAALVPDEGKDVDVEAFARVARELPDHAQPRFLRILPALDTTGTFKIQKKRLRDEGADPSRIADPLHVRSAEGYDVLSVGRWESIVQGRSRI
ncbi:MAG: AMP-binding protein [Myxococcota bacterium]